MLRTFPNRSFVSAAALVLFSLTMAPQSGNAHEPNEGDGHEHREHGVHVHGLGLLGVALDGTSLEIEIDAAADNFLGFEHAPQTEEQSEALAALKSQLGQPADLFVLSEDAGCTVQSSQIELAGLDKVGEHDHDHEQMHEGEHEHDHDHESETGHGDEHRHANVEARYSFSCTAPDALDAVDVKLFALYPRFEKIEAVVLTETGQGAEELTPDHTVLTVR